MESNAESRAAQRRSSRSKNKTMDKKTRMKTMQKTMQKMQGITMKRDNQQKQELIMRAQEASDWINYVMTGKPIDNSVMPERKVLDQLFTSLATGVVLCDVMAKIQASTPNFSGQKCYSHKNAQPDSFQARENAVFFTKAAKEYGLHANVLFEPDDLVSRKNEKQVINTILAVSKAAARKKTGISPPQIVQFEIDLESEEKGDEGGSPSKPGAATSTEEKAAPAPTPAPAPEPAPEPAPAPAQPDMESKYAEKPEVEEEAEEIIPEEYGLQLEELEAIEAGFDAVMKAASGTIKTRRDLFERVCQSEPVQKCVKKSESFARKIAALDVKSVNIADDALKKATFEVADVKEFLRILAEQHAKSLEKEKEKETGVVAAPQQQKKRQSDADFAGCDWLPYIPVVGDPIDERVAQSLNSNFLDLEVKRVRHRNKPGQTEEQKQRHRKCKGYYRVYNQRVHIRIIRNMVMVRCNHAWEEFTHFCTKKMEEELEHFLSSTQ